MKNYYTLILFLLLYVFSTLLYADSYVIEPDDESMFYYNNATLTKKRRGIREFRVLDNLQSPTYNHDLLMHFDSNLTDTTGNYKSLMTGYVSKYERGKYGNASLFLPSENYFVELIPNHSDSFFGADNNISSFTIEFFIKPSRFLIEARVLSKIGPYNIGGGLNTFGGLAAYIREGRLIWSFHNFFFLDDKPRDVTLSQGSFLKSNEWSHHSITFDSTTGKLTKYLNGVEEQFIYMTSTGDEYGSICYPKFDKNNNNPVIIGSGFLGDIDELSITMTAKTNFNIEQYRDESLIVSKVVDLKSPYAFINDLDVETRLEKGSEVLIYYRASPIYFLPNDNMLEWKSFEPGTKIDTMARYFQIKLVLLSSDFNEVTPYVGLMSINYDVILPPPIPTDLKAYPLDGGVKLVWDAVGEYSSVVGYKVYYGTEPLLYDSVNSPIIIGKTNEYIVDNLENDQIYYFSISAFDSISENHQSAFSQEVYARPRSFYTNDR